MSLPAAAPTSPALRRTMSARSILAQRPARVVPPAPAAVALQVADADLAPWPLPVRIAIIVVGGGLGWGLPYAFYALARATLS